MPSTINDLSSAIIGAAIEVHRALGPGLLESAYEQCLAQELSLREIPFERQKRKNRSQCITRGLDWTVAIGWTFS
jgi:GxxExxY protein